MGAITCAACFATYTSVSAGEAYTLTLKDHRFEPAQLTIKAETPATLVVKNLDATPEEFESKTLRIEKINLLASFMKTRQKANSLRSEECSARSSLSFEKRLRLA